MNFDNMQQLQAIQSNINQYQSFLPLQKDPIMDTQTSGTDNHYLNNSSLDRKRIHSESSIQVPPKKKRFCWDDALHYRFLEFIFCYGLEHISSTKLHEILESMNVIIPVDFLDSYINYLRSHSSHVLMDFSRAYQEALQYQESYTSEGNPGRFSVYPFPPPSLDSLQPDPFIPWNNPSDVPATLPIQESREYHEQEEPRPEDHQELSPLLSRTSITLPRGMDDVSFLFHSPMDRPDTIMDSQIQLHQNMLYQSDYMLSRNREPSLPTQIPDLDETPSIPHPSTDFSISTFLSAPTGSYLQAVDSLLMERNGLNNSPISPHEDNQINIFDFLNEA